MPQTSALIRTLKSCLKAERKTYADVAKALNLTEASVKRLFAQECFTLERLDAICQMLGMEITDLVQKMHESTRRLERLTPAQERELTEDLVLLLVTVCVFNRWTLAEITRIYDLSEDAVVGKLIRLDRLGIIELLPGNRVKLLISPNFQWNENGPIQQFFQKTIGREFFDSRFTREGECLLVLNGMLSPASNAEFQRKLQRLAHEFNERNDADLRLPFEQRHGVTLVMAMRHWEYGLFQHMKRG